METAHCQLENLSWNVLLFPIHVREGMFFAQSAKKYFEQKITGDSGFIVMSMSKEDEVSLMDTALRKPLYPSSKIQIKKDKIPTK